MRLLHRRGDDRRVLASTVETADSTLARARGLMFRRSIPDDYALRFPFERPDARSLHMLFVPFAIDAVWLVEDEVIAVERLRPWVGFGRGTADAVIELPAGAADGVRPGDAVTVERGDGTAPRNAARRSG